MDDEEKKLNTCKATVTKNEEACIKSVEKARAHAVWKKETEALFKACKKKQKKERDSCDNRKVRGMV